MTLAEYKEETGKTWETIAAESGVSVVTLLAVSKGMRLVNYRKARDLSSSTDGMVTVKELCE